MGMYTEISFRATLKRDVPDEVLAAIRAMLGQVEANPGDLPKHELFKLPRWEMLACGSSYYFPQQAPSGIEYDDAIRAHGVYFNASLKNYHDEISQFFDWIDPYVDAAEGEYIGYELYEDVEPGTPPIPYFKK